MRSLSETRQHVITEILHLYKSGLTIEKVHKTLGVSRATIRKYLYLNNIPIRRYHNNVLTAHNRIPLNQKVFNEYLNKAKKRNLPFDLSLSIFTLFIFDECYYCGSKPKRVIKYHSEDGLVNGIDRLDYEMGYTIKNCVTCCAMCNRMKNIYPEKEFLDQIIRICTYRVKL